MDSSSPFRINSFYAEGEGCGSIPHWEPIIQYQLMHYGYKEEIFHKGELLYHKSVG